jgi:hypothetical protein
MYKQAPLLALLLLSLHSQASEWVALPDTGTDQYFYDNSKLVIKDEEITYWKKVIFKIPQAIKGREATSGILRERIHCGEHTAKLMSYLYYSASGETIEYMAQDDSPATPVIPDTVGDAFDRVLCPLVWRKQEENRIKAEQSATEAELKKPVIKKEEAKPAIAAPVKPVPPQVPNVRLPDKQPLPQLPMPQIPMPQIMEQLY